MGELERLIDKLGRERELAHDEYVFLLEQRTPEAAEYLRTAAQKTALAVYGRTVYLRGLIEFTNFCRNDCYYCGIRKSNRHAGRYRLTEDEILRCCDAGYGFGLRTFVLQGGEDTAYDEDRICALVRRIKAAYPDCAITLSVGEKSRGAYERFFAAGADRYLLRHETADPAHYRHLHPESLSAENRVRCLRDLKEIGFQVGAGFMVGSPGQTYDHLAKDLAFLRELDPQMIGIGPFLHHKDTPFHREADGTTELTLYCLSILRLMFPKVLLPATTALGTVDPQGREKGILAGANVIMPSLSPKDVRGKYLLYDGKICTDEEAAECHAGLKERLAAIGYETVSARGDYAGWSR